MVLTPELEAQLGQIYGQQSGGLTPDVENQLKQIYGVQPEYQTDPVRTAYQGAMNNVAKPINQGFGQVASAIGHLVPQGVKDKLSAAGNYLANEDAITSPFIQDLRKTAQGAGKSLDELKSLNPDLERDLSAFGENVGLAANLSIAKPVVGALAPAIGKIEKASQKLPGILGDVSGAPAPKAPKITPDMLNVAAPNAYKFVEASDTGFTPNFSTKAQSILENSKLSLIGGKVLLSEDAEINAALGEFDALKGTPLTLKDFQRIDSNLGNKAAKAYITNDPNKARIIGDAQDKIRKLVNPESLSAQDITGSTEGITTLTEHAIPMWSVKRKIEDLQQIVDNANMTKNPQTALQTGMKNFIKSGRIDSYPEETQALIRQMAKNGTGADLLGIVGSRLNPIIAGAAGGPAAGVVAQGTSLAARTIGNRLVNNRADAIINSLLEQVRPSIEKFSGGVPSQPVTPPFKPYGLLPAPQTTMVTNSAGQTVPLTPAGREIIGQSPNAPYEPTLQEIQKMPFDQGKAALNNYLRRKNTRR